MNKGGNLNEDARIIGLWTNISEQLGEIAGQMKSVLSQLADHTLRIQQLERHPSNQPVTIQQQSANMSLASVVRWLVIALIVSLGIIATLTGSTAIIRTMLAPLVVQQN